jgi:hypothetical protein
MMKVEAEGQARNGVGLATRKCEDEPSYLPIVNTCLVAIT